MEKQVKDLIKALEVVVIIGNRDTPFSRSNGRHVEEMTHICQNALDSFNRIKNEK